MCAPWYVKPGGALETSAKAMRGLEQKSGFSDQTSTSYGEPFVPISSIGSDKTQSLVLATTPRTLCDRRDLR